MGRLSISLLPWIQLQILANALDALEANGQPRAAQVVAACFDKVCDKL